MSTFTNQATLSFNGQTVVSNVVTGQLRSGLTLTKTADSETYVPGGQIVYAVSVVNTAAADYTDLTLTDDLGTYTEGGRTMTPLALADGSVMVFVNGALQSAPAVTAGPPLTVGGFSVPAGGSVVVVYSVTVTEAAPPAAGGEIVNTVTLTGAQVVSEPTASASVSAAEEPLLSIEKSLSPAEVDENGELTYTFRITNLGNQPAAADAAVSVSDVFAPALQNIAVTLNGTALARTTGFTYDEASGAFATVPGQITVPAATFSQSVTDGTWITVPGEAVLTVSGSL